MANFNSVFSIFLYWANSNKKSAPWEGVGLRERGGGGGGVLFDDQRPQGVEIQLSMMGLSSDLGGRTFYILKTLPNFIITHAASVSGLANVFL